MERYKDWKDIKILYFKMIYFNMSKLFPNIGVKKNLNRKNLGTFNLTLPTRQQKHRFINYEDSLFIFSPPGTFFSTGRFKLRCD